MKINKIEPQGYCKGVIRALKLCEDAINNKNTPRPIRTLYQAAPPLICFNSLSFKIIKISPF